MKCRLCRKTAAEIQGWLLRVNELGVPGIGECRPSCAYTKETAPGSPNDCWIICRRSLRPPCPLPTGEARLQMLAAGHYIFDLDQPKSQAEATRMLLDAYLALMAQRTTHAQLVRCAVAQRN